MTKQRDLILRDILAVERTALSNERTFYSAVRTGLTFFIAGITIIKFVGEVSLLQMSGWFFILAAFIIMIVAFLRLFLSVRKIQKGLGYLPDRSEM